MSEPPTRTAELAVAIANGPTANTVNGAGRAGAAGAGTATSRANTESNEQDISLKDFLNLLSHVYQVRGRGGGYVLRQSRVVIERKIIWVKLVKCKAGYVKKIRST